MATVPAGYAHPDVEHLFLNRYAGLPDPPPRQASFRFVHNLCVEEYLAC